MATAEPTGRLAGYARVSTRPGKSRKAQHVDNQVQRLYDAGCEIVFTDEITGKKASRPGWDRCLAYLRPGDTLVFTRLDRIGRSLPNLVSVVTDLGHRGVQLRSLDQGAIDTTTPHGKLLFAVMSAIAEFEADIARERTIEGMDAARERHGGTLPVRGPSITADQKATARMLARSGMPAGRIAKVVGVSRATLYRHVDLAAERAAA
jgi:DNA invertase Pin-like site-specific DNA recombinase